MAPFGGIAVGAITYTHTARHHVIAVAYCSIQTMAYCRHDFTNHSLWRPTYIQDALHLAQSAT
jgi:hypothetical protein